MHKKLVLGKPVQRVPEGDSILILRNGVVEKSYPIIVEKNLGLLYNVFYRIKTWLF